MRKSAIATRLPAGGPAVAQSGFSLVELIVVMVLIGIIFAVFGVGYMRSVSSAEIRNASREIIAGIRHTRGQAIVKRQQQVFILDSANRTWQAAGRPPVQIPDGLELRMITARSELTSEQAGGIRFYPDGASTGGSVILSMQDREWAINVAWLTGEVSLERDDR